MQTHRLLRPVLSLALLASLSHAPGAQCPGPDGLNGPCWQPVVPNLPQFPPWSIESTNVCWTQCVPQQVCSLVAIGQPIQFACARYNASFTMFDCGFNPLLGGSIDMEYTRTWDEVVPTQPPQRLQVWRFAIKTDLTPVNPAFADPCSIPPCLQTHHAAFYYGYMDYALDCVTGQWQNAMVLYHNCDEFIHDPSLSSTPGTFHPDKAYAIVAPDTPANPFVAALAPPPVGPIVAEAVRIAAPPGAPCIAEDPVQGNVQFLGDGCGCKFALNPKQLAARKFTGTGSCVAAGFGASSFATLALWPTYPWYHMMTASIGTWTTAAAYPGVEFAWVDEGAILYKDSCELKNYGELYYGGSTSGGYDVLPGMVPLTQNFTDVASNVSFELPGGPAGPLVGSVMSTRNLIYVNVP